MLKLYIKKYNNKIKKRILFIMFLITVVIVWLIFAFIPDVLNFAPLPTGGWDWLGFIGVILGILFALLGVVLTIEHENKLTREQNRKAVLPCLDVPINEILDCSDEKLYIFREFKEIKGVLVNEGYAIEQLRDGFKSNKSIKLRNIGLSTAFSVNMYMYKLDGVEGLNSLDDINKRSLKDLYGNIKTSSYEYKEDERLLNDEWQIYTTFNLTNDERSEIDFVFDHRGITNSFHNIIEFRYSDIYKNQYYQLLYLYFDSNRMAIHPMSKIYEGTNHKEVKD